MGVVVEISVCCEVDVFSICTVMVCAAWLSTQLTSEVECKSRSVVGKDISSYRLPFVPPNVTTVVVSGQANVCYP